MLKDPHDKRIILWAVDPFAEEGSLQRSAARAIQSLRLGKNVAVEPVYLWNAFPSTFALNVSGELERQLRDLGQREVNRILGDLSVEGLQPMSVLVEPHLSLSGEARELAKYARNRGAEMIVLSTRAKKSPFQWILGSFAESLVLHGEVPILVVNPRCESTGVFKRILFPTDFSEESRRAYDNVLILASGLGAEVTIFNKLGADLGPVINIALSSQPPFREVFQGEIDRSQKAGEEWCREAERAGVRAKLEIDSKYGGSAADAILKRDPSSEGLIAMATYSGAVRRTLAGSTTRQVVREACCPVWLVHPDYSVSMKAAS